MAKILCVLYDDPVNGYPNSYARDGIPKIERYSGGQTTPTPKGIDFIPGELLGLYLVNLDCVNSAKVSVIFSSSPLTKRERTRSLNASCPMPKSSSRNHSGRLT